MSNHSEAFIAFDSSKLRNAVAIADPGRTGEIRFLGEIENSTTATAKLVRKLAGKYERLTFCYEAGPTGYELYRQIKSLGHECIVVAPITDSEEAGRSSEDQPARRGQLSEVVARRRTHRGMGSRSASRGNA
jgi:transposase